MRLLFDLDTRQFITLAGFRDPLTTISFKRGDTVPVAIQFISGGVAGELETGATGCIGLKTAYDGGFLAVATEWVKSGTGTSAVYTFALNLNTVPLNALLSGTTPCITALFELEFIQGDVRASSQTLVATIQNDVVKGTEGTPVELPDAWDWLAANRKAAIIRTADQGIPSRSRAQVASLTISGTLVAGTSIQVHFMGGLLPAGFPQAVSYLESVLADTSASTLAAAIAGHLNANAKVIAAGYVFANPSGAVITVTAPAAADNDDSLVLSVQSANGITGGDSATTAVGVAAAAPAFIGQLCRVGDAEPYRWFVGESLSTDGWVEIMVASDPITPQEIGAQPLLTNDPAQFITLPIADGYQSCTHPSVVRVPGGWNGYEYWMACTPYPDAARENPHIFASHDGTTWIVPAGASNPVFPISDSVMLGYANWSDPNLIILHTTIGSHAAGTMVLFARAMYGAGNEALYFRTSTDGVHWSAYVQIATNPAGNPKYASPSVVQLTDGTMALWAMDNTGTSSWKVRKYTSSNMVSWTSYAGSTLCVLDNDLTNGVWHFEVRHRDGYFHMLGVTRWYNVFYVRSADGVTWAGMDAGANCVMSRKTEPLADSAAAFDKRGFYRPSFSPTVGKPNCWDIWIPCVGSQQWNNPAVPAIDNNFFNAINRIMYLREFNLNRIRLYVEAYGGAQAVGGSYTPAKATCISNVLNGGWWNSARKAFIPPPGWYLVTFNVHWDAATVAARYLRIGKNGTDGTWATVPTDCTGNMAGITQQAGQNCNTLTMPVYANGTDSFEVFVVSGAAGGTLCTPTSNPASHGTFLHVVSLDQ